MNRITLLIVLLMITSITAAKAAEFCATNSAQLQASLDAAETNGQADTIRVATGNYEVPIGGGFVYNSLAPVGGDDHDISVIGGWTTFFGNPCGQVLSTNAFNTLLDGDNRFRVLYIQTQEFSNITVKNIAMINGFATTAIPNRGGAMWVGGGGDYVGDMLIENTMMLGNEARFGGGLHINRGDTVRVINNLVVANHTTAGTAGVELVSNDADGIYLINNTILLNTTDSTSSSATGGAYVANNGSSEAFIANNILWGNDARDLHLLGSGEKHLHNNNIEDRFGGATFETGNLSVDPQFNSGILNFTLSDNSPMRDAGRNPPIAVPVPPRFEFIWDIPDFDLANNQRIQGVRVDIGAYEAFPSFIFSDGFE